MESKSRQAARCCEDHAISREDVSSCASPGPPSRMFLDVFLAAVSTLEGQLLGRAVTATWLLTLEVKEYGAALGGRQGASTEIPALASPSALVRHSVSAAAEAVTVYLEPPPVRNDPCCWGLKPTSTWEVKFIKSASITDCESPGQRPSSEASGTPQAHHQRPSKAWTPSSAGDRTHFVELPLPSTSPVSCAC